jgi:hypothetical protein
MDPVDGNAIAGQLLEFYGAEMTMTTGVCERCGLRTRIAELVVYARGPGSVARCPGCGSVLIVVVDVREATEVHLCGFDLEPRVS